MKGVGGGGHHNNIKRCRRQCIEARSAYQSARSAEKIFRLHFSLLRMVSRGTLAALHCKFQMYEDCRAQGRHELLPCSNFAHERNTYVHGGVYYYYYYYYYLLISPDGHWRIYLTISLLASYMFH